ncbi:MAG: uridine kinase family protein [Candidatus Saccharimonadales bacterium]
MKVIGIAGGSGAGKSTICYKLVDSNPKLYEVLNFDDYQKVGETEGLPRLHGFINWDHPDIIRWDELIQDIETLKSGRAVTIQTWAHRSNPDYADTRQMISRTIKPKPILLVEGYLALYDPKLRALYDKTIYLDIDEKTRNQRRDKAIFTGGSDYQEKVLKPMFNQYVLPTRDLADLVIDVSNLNLDEVMGEIDL